MSDKMKDTGINDQKQPSIDDLAALADSIGPVRKEPESLVYLTIPPRDYNLNTISNFLDVVFHAGLDDDENILTWKVNPTRHPAYPITDDQLLGALSKSKKAQALYFATATCTREDGKLYHRKKLFSSLRVVVLDDIGTKVPVDKIPADFPPSYIIESSEGNYQYGYVLDEPVETLSAAEALIQLVYESGYSDEGGKTPVKLVRLPEGVNGKKGEKGPFVSALTSLTDVTYSPQQILDALQIHVSWSDVLVDADAVTKSRASKSLGSTPWASVSPQGQAMNGFIDPVLEWMYDERLVAHDNGGEWIDIKCPWHEGHTTGDTARYKPLGRGDNVEQRAFHCHHGHCKDTNNTAEFLKYIATNSGIQAGQFDPSAELTTRYVFDKIQNSVWDIKSDVRDIRIPMNSFGTLHPHKTMVYTIEGKEKLASLTSLWAVSPSRVTVVGPTYDPSTTARLVSKKGENYVNLFTIPNWGHGPIVDKHVDTFTQYVEYLIPDVSDRDYFLMWLAAKCQNMAFKGAAIVMVADRQGVGRSTLADMIKTLLGGTNVADVPFAEMVGDSQFNEWQEKPFIVSEETLAGDATKFYNSYEKLKTLVDPRSRAVTINPKFGVKREAMSYSSYLFLTNHINAIALPEGDRRFYVMKNAIIPASPAYFMKLNEWLDGVDDDGMPSWGRAVYRWLQTLSVDMETLLAPPPETQTKKDMAGASLNDLDFAVAKLVEIWPSPYITAGDLYRVFRSPIIAGPLQFDEDTNVKYVKRQINRISTSYTGVVAWDVSINKAARPRLLNRYLTNGCDHAPLIVNGSTKKDIQNTTDILKASYAAREIDVDDLAGQLSMALSEDDRI